jgi:hypothetical protein
MAVRSIRLPVCLASLLLAGGALLGVLACNRSPGELPPELPQETATKPPSAAALELDPAQREYLWEIEHHGLVLGKYGFKRIKEALAQGDANALRNLLAADFTGAMYQDAQEVRLQTDFVNVARHKDAGKPRKVLTGPEFVEQLLSFRRPFTKPPKVQTNLMKLAPVEVGNLDSPLWQGSCLLRMWGEVQAGQPSEVTLTLEYRVPRPTEENLARNGWLHTAALAQSVVGQSNRFLLREVTRERGIDPSQFQDNWLLPNVRERKPNTGGVYLCDFDRDGILDLLVTDTHGYFLYKGLPGGKFTDVTEDMGLPRKAMDLLPCTTLAAFVDLDGDGWEDLILGNRIYRNMQGKRFVDYTFRTNLRLPLDANGIALADYDRDSNVDLYITRASPSKKDSWLGGKRGDKQGNQLWRNLGNWRFQDVTEATGTAGGSRSTFSAVWLDVNNDGWPDLYVINEFGNGVLLLNQGNGTFRERQLAEGPNDFGSMGVTCGDIDNDGNIDLYIGNMYSKAGARVMSNLKPDTYAPEVMAKMRQFVAGSQLWHNRGNLQFDKLGEKCQVAAVGWAYGAALVDLDNDGFLDLYATAGFMSQSRDDPDG